MVYRSIDDKHYVAVWDYRLGWVVKKLKPEATSKLKSIDEKAWTVNGQKFPPYSPNQIEEFMGLSKKKLEKLVEESKNR